MKKLRYIGLIAGLIILISSKGEAQYYYTSYGYAQDWYLPGIVHTTIYDNYYGYEIAHVQQYQRQGNRNFNVLLHRNGWFVELRFDQHGHIYRTIRHRYNYPLISHNCTNHCGYHQTYYQTYYPKYHHAYYKHGYQTTVYVTSNGYGNYHQPNNYYTNVYVEKQHNKPSNYKGNNQGYQQNQGTVQQQSTRSSQPKVIRQPQQRNTPNVEQSRPLNNSRMQQARTQQATRQNTSRGQTRNMVVRNERSQ